MNLGSVLFGFGLGCLVGFGLAALLVVRELTR